MSAHWFYARDGQQQGPVTDEEFRLLVIEGVVQEHSLIWREGMADWRKLQDVPDAPRAVAAAAQVPPGRCSWCGGAFPEEDLVQLAGHPTCAACKPQALQRLEEGASVATPVGYRRPRPVDPDALIAEIRNRGYDVDIGILLRRSWALYKANFWPCMGASTIVVLLSQVIGIIPFIGAILSILFQGPLFAGLYVFYLKVVRRQPAQVGDIFWGFNPDFWRYMLTALLVMLPTLAVMVAVMIPVFIGLVFLSDAGGNGPSPGLLLVLVPVGVAAALAGIYFQVVLGFALPLAADLEMGPVNAALTSFRAINVHIWRILLLMIVTGLIVLVGFLGFFIGIFFTMPIYWLTIMLLYEEIFAMRGAPGTAPAASVVSPAPMS